jgi:serine/threonine protein kinase
VVRPEPAIGDVFAGCRIEAVAGKGGMGIVYKATQLALDRQVAVKVIAAALADDAGFRQRFMRESKVAASLDHPNVVTVFHAGEDEGLLYIAMRFVDGTDLRKLIALEHHLDAARAADVVMQVASALDAAHERGLVHRDVKPGNILLRRVGMTEHAYLSDFGLTKHTTSVGGITETGHWVGTLDYVAPEQIQGSPADARADIYSLGAVLYEALTGSVPFPMASEAAKLYAHLEQPAPGCSAAGAGIPAAFDAVIARALAKAPADRYPSAGDLGRAAVAAAHGSPLPAVERSIARGEAAPLEHPSRPTPAAGQRRTVVEPIVPTAPAPTAVAPPPTASSQVPTSGGSVAGRRTTKLPIVALVVVVAVIAAVGALLALSGGNDGAAPAHALAIGSPPDDVAPAAGGGAWATTAARGAVVRIDAPGERVSARAPVSGNPFRVVADADGVWAASSLKGEVTRIDPSTRRATTTVSLPGEIFDVGLGAGAVWVTQRTGPGPLTRKPTVVTRIDTASGRVTGDSASVGRGPADVAVGQGAVWAADEDAATVSRIDSVSGRLVGAPVRVGSKISGIAAGREGVWVVDDDAAAAHQINVKSGGVLKTVELGGRPVDVAVGGGRVWVVDSAANQLVEIDPRRGRVQKRIAVGGGPTAVAVDGRAVWVANATDSSVSRIGL